jgi:hypothetical protein
MGRPILFKCPQAGMNVQHWLADAPEYPDSDTAVVCHACTGIHFVHSSTGKLLGKSNE